MLLILSHTHTDKHTKSDIGRPSFGIANKKHFLEQRGYFSEQFSPWDAKEIKLMAPTDSATTKSVMKFLVSGEET